MSAIVSTIGRMTPGHLVTTTSQETATLANKIAVPLACVTRSRVKSKARDDVSHWGLAFDAPVGPRAIGSPAARLSSISATQDHDRMRDTETSLRAENAELRRLLEKHQWAGLTPFKSSGCCPECSGPAPPRGSGHRPGCAIAAILH
jgi:hypothetical protein